MQIDLNFIGDMLYKYTAHLQNVETSITKLVDDYDRQISSLEKLPRYAWRIKELENKKTEAFTKLSHVVPNIEKMREQMAIINSHRELN